MTRYKEGLDKISASIEELQANRENMSDAEYINKFATYNKMYYSILEMDQYQNQVHEAIANSDDLKNYQIYESMKEGIISADNPAYKNYNNFFTLDGEIVDSRTIDMGPIFFNSMIDYFDSNGIDYQSYDSNIKVVPGQKEFIINKDQQAFMDFSKAYAVAAGYDQSFLTFMVKDLFTNTANDLFGSDGQLGDGTQLRDAGTWFFDYEKNAKNTELKYGIKPYTMPIVLYDVSVNRLNAFANGENQTELNILKEDVYHKLKGSSLQNYTVYGNVTDIKADNGGYGSFSKITDPKTLYEIQSEITGILSNSKAYKDRGDIVVNFATSGYKFGTNVRIPKGTGYYEVFIENFLPNKATEDFVSDPYFKSTAYVNTIMAQNNPKAINLHNICGLYLGNFVSNRPEHIGYKLDGSDKIVTIGRDEAIQLKYLTEQFENYCMQNAMNNDPKSAEENIENMRNWLRTGTDKSPGLIGLIYTCLYGSGQEESEDVIEEKLIDVFKNYYRRTPME